MATYSELYELHVESPLRNKVRIACIIAAETIVSDTAPPANQDKRLMWAASAFRNVDSVAEPMFKAVIAANNTADIGAIMGASDAAIQSNVDDHIDLFADLL